MHGDADTVVTAARSRADVDRPGSGLREEAQSDACTLAWYEQRKAILKALWEVGFQTAVKAHDQDRALVQGAESRALYSESQANVKAQHLCSPLGTSKSADGSGCVGLMENKRQRDEAVGGGSGGAGTASCFLGSELQLESLADVAWTDATISDGRGGGSMGSDGSDDYLGSMGGGRQQGETASGQRHYRGRHGKLPSRLRAPGGVSSGCSLGGRDGR